MTQKELQILGLVAIAVIFGAIAHVAHWFSNKNDITITWIMIISSIVVCCFAGTVFGLLVSVYTDSLVFIILASSLGAYMGDKGIEKVWEKILDLISKR